MNTTFLEYVVFFAASLMMLGGAIGVITLKNPVHAALGLVLTLFGVAVQFVAQEAHFLAAVQVIVYAGAIVVLFLFVIMLLGVDRSVDLSIEPIKIQRPLAAVMMIGLVALITAAVIRAGDAIDHVLAFELTSVLLIVAVVGTVLLTRKWPKQSEQSDSEGVSA